MLIMFTAISVVNGTFVLKWGFYIWYKSKHLVTFVANLLGFQPNASLWVSAINVYAYHHLSN